MKLKRLVPIMNVSNLQESFTWFEKIGWTKGWEWGEPSDFGGVQNGELEIFLCENCQGSRSGPMPRHVEEDDTGGIWMSWFLESTAAVDAAYQLALEQGVTVTRPPHDYPWNMREFHVRHPDGHTFRIGAELQEE